LALDRIMTQIDDHPLRYQLANELHARPFPTLQAPCRAVYLALAPVRSGEDRDRDAERSHLIALLDRHGAPHPQPGATHYTGQIGRHRLKWESHTEFVTYTVFLEGLSERPFDPDDTEVLPEDWLATAPGQRITSALIRVEARDADATRSRAPIAKALSEWFLPESLASARVLDGDALIAGDFHIDPMGHMRFAVFAKPGVGASRIGRIVQRLCEIETYKTMSMLGFAHVRETGADLSRIEQALTELIAGMTSEGAAEERQLQDLLTLAAELESLQAKGSFRFGATRAYAALVGQRIEVLREARYEGRQTFSEFMMRRFDPAMRTVTAHERRLEGLAARAMRAGELLRTRVEVTRSAQNQTILESMDRRADFQLRLQETVESLSVVAISYYAVSLGGYLLAPFVGPLGLSKAVLTAIITPPVIAAVWFMARRIRKSVIK
jgi:uncharacterized membrane-anchored protein